MGLAFTWFVQKARWIGMIKFLLPSGSLQPGNSRRSARVGVACILGALLASCATGVSIDDEVLFIPATPRVQGDDELAADEDGPGGVEPSKDDAELSADTELTPPAEMSEGTPEIELVPSAEPEDDEPPSSSAPADEPPASDDSDPGPPDDEPITDPDVDVPDPGPGPITPPAPGSDVSPDDLSPDDAAPTSGPTNPPAPSDPLPTPDPGQTPIPVLPAAGHCLGGWEGSSCDVCSGQTQSDLLACRMYIDCYIVNDCDPISCGSLEQSCGVNRLGNGLAPKGVADAVYGCMCAP